MKNNKLLFWVILSTLSSFLHAQQLEQVTERKTAFKIKYFCHPDPEYAKSSAGLAIFNQSCNGQFIASNKTFCLSKAFNLSCPSGQYLTVAAEAGECLPSALNATIIPVTSSLSDLLKLCNKSRTH